jgi:predicted nucleic-acid-binding protein
MNGILVDSCVLLDLFTDDPEWASWSEKILGQYSQTNTLFINSIIYTEVSIGFNRIEEVEDAIDSAF